MPFARALVDLTNFARLEFRAQSFIIGDLGWTAMKGDVGKRTRAIQSLITEANIGPSYHML